MQGTDLSGWGEKSLLCDPGSELRVGGRAKRRAKILNRTGTKKTTRKKKNKEESTKKAEKNVLSAPLRDSFPYTKLRTW